MTRRLILLSVLACLLAACGGTGTGLIRRINPPGIIVQHLKLMDDGQVSVELRVNNHSTVPTVFERLQLKFTVAGVDLADFALAPRQTIPALAADVVAVTWRPDPAALAALRAQAGGSWISYSLRGLVHTSEPSDTFDFEYQSRLSPVPGLPGEFR